MGESCTVAGKWWPGGSWAGSLCTHCPSPRTECLHCLKQAEHLTKRVFIKVGQELAILSPVNAWHWLEAAPEVPWGARPGSCFAPRPPPKGAHPGEPRWGEGPGLWPSLGEPWRLGCLTLPQDTEDSSPASSLVSHSLGVRRVPEAHDGKVHLAEGGRRQVLPEQEPPEVLPSETGVRGLLLTELRAGGEGWSWHPLSRPHCSQTAFRSVTKARHLEEAGNCEKAAPEPGLPSSQASPGGRLAWREGHQASLGGHCRCPPTLPRLEEAPAPPWETSRLFTGRVPHPLLPVGGWASTAMALG